MDDKNADSDTNTRKSLKSYFKKLWAGDDSDVGPIEDTHEDENAQIGDTRYYVQPMGEIMGYDSEGDRKRIHVSRQKYAENGVYKNGNKHYMWKKSKRIFKGSIEEWEQVKENPEEHFQDIPVEWEKIIEHVDNFIDINREYLNLKEYPHSVLKINN